MLSSLQKVNYYLRGHSKYHLQDSKPGEIHAQILFRNGIQLDGTQATHKFFPNDFNNQVGKYGTARFYQTVLVYTFHLEISLTSPRNNSLSLAICNLGTNP